jgi:hypothetical protein
MIVTDVVHALAVQSAIPKVWPASCAIRGAKEFVPKLVLMFMVEVAILPPDPSVPFTVHAELPALHGGLTDPN